MAYTVVKVELNKAQLAKHDNKGSMAVVFPDVAQYLSDMERDGWQVVATATQGSSGLVVTLHRADAPDPV